jgi:tRNA (guanosine-2'-O-)-methyltransferase
MTGGQMTGGQPGGGQSAGKQAAGKQAAGKQAAGKQAAGSSPRRQLGPTDVKRLNRSWRRLTSARICLLLDSVSQPFNVGSIIRTAAALGVEHLWLCADSASPDHPSARKTALGTERYLTWEQVSDTAAAAAAARAAGLAVIAIELARDATPLHQAPLGGDVCIALGNEDRGCSAALLAAADAIGYVPQTGRVGSLNVAAAAAIALAEARRREWELPGWP